MFACTSDLISTKNNLKRCREHNGPNTLSRLTFPFRHERWQLEIRYRPKAFPIPTGRSEIIFMGNRAGCAVLPPKFLSVTSYVNNAECACSLEVRDPETP